MKLGMPSIVEAYCRCTKLMDGSGSQPRASDFLTDWKRKLLKEATKYLVKQSGKLESRS